MRDYTYFHNRPLSPVILTVAGILMGLLLALLAAWADYESTAYGFPRRAQTSLQGLTCPVFIGKYEHGTVSIKISNPTERTLSPGIRTQISTPFEPDSRIEYVQLAPGEHITLQRTIGPENVDLGMFIFVDALVYSIYPVPDQESTCGILVLPVANGALVSIFGTTFSILLMAGGTYIRNESKHPGRRTRPVRFLVIATLLAMTLGFTGWWLPTVMLIILLILTLLIQASAFLTPK
jgi:hypothetical protein